MMRAFILRGQLESAVMVGVPEATVSVSLLAPFFSALFTSAFATVNMATALAPLFTSFLSALVPATDHKAATVVSALLTPFLAPLATALVAVAKHLS